MSATASRKNGEQNMPVKELPMPPVKIQRQDSSGGVVKHSQVAGERAPVPQIANLQLRLNHG